MSAGADTSAAANRRVLVVDDDRDALQILGDFLESKSIEVVTAIDGHEALTRFHDDGPFDVVVLDVMMPGLDGLEVCRRLKASPQGQLTPVLLVSARTDTKSRVAGLYGGADEYINKPVDLREFLARLEVLIRVRDRYRELANRRNDDIEAALGDSLTGTANASYFTRRLQNEIHRADRYNLPLTVILGDVIGLPEAEAMDDAKEHDGSSEILSDPTDELLAHLGHVLSSALRSHDLIARLRRSRFAILLPHTSKHSAQEAIERLKSITADMCARAATGEGPKAGLSLLCGCAELGPKMDAESLLARAEPL